MIKIISILNSVMLVILISACKKEKTHNLDQPVTNNPTNPSPTNCDSSLLIALEFNSNYKDSSCNIKDALNNNTNWTMDRFGHTYKAIQFAGNAYVEVPNDSLLHPDFPFTISFWVNPADSSNANNTFYTACTNTTGNGNYGFSIATTPSGVIGVSYGDGTNNGVTNTFSSAKLRSNQWTHVTVVFAAPGDVRIYLNGTLDGGATTMPNLASSIVYLPVSNVSAKGRIGGNGNYIGKLDKIKIWKKTLSNTEIQTEFLRAN